MLSIRSILARGTMARSFSYTPPKIHSTTVLNVRKGSKVAMMADGQISMGESILFKGTAKKVRVLPNNVMCGFAGTAADCLAIVELLEKELEKYPGQTLRACLSLAQLWRKKEHSRLQGSVIVSDPTVTVKMDGSGNCIEIEDGVVAIGSGGLYALSAARALIDDESMSAEEICRRAMRVAGDLCLFTNHSTMLRTLDVPTEEKASTPTVAYWDERAKGAQIFYLLAYCGADHKRDTLVRGPAPDYNKDAWTERRADLDLPFPNVPYLLDEESGVRLTESKSIMKYIAMQHEPDLLGRDAAEVGICDMVSRVHDDWYAQLSRHGKKGDEKGLQRRIDTISQQVATFLEAPKLFAAGANLTFIDFSLFELVDYMNVYSKGRVFERHPGLKAYHERITELPRFREAWADDQKLMKRPFKFYDKERTDL